MKSSAFGDRARQLATWFQEWNQCEQTIALYSLLTKVSATQARFFSLVLEHTLKNGQDSQELARMENDANNPAFLSAIHSEPDNLALQQLLSHIPLLHPGNNKAREEYLKLLPKVLFGSIEDSDYLYQCRQLISLALVHPAFPHEDREKLKFWLSRLEERCRNIAERNGTLTHQPYHQLRSMTLPSSPPRRIYQLHTGHSDDLTSRKDRIYITLPPGSSQNLQFVDGFDGLGEVDTYPSFEDDDEPIQKAFTLSSGQSLFTTLPLQEHCSTPNGYDDYKRMKNKSLSLPNNRAPSACSLPASFDDQIPFLWKPGMKDVPVWLKSLRLHKYQQLFVDMTYEDLLDTTEDFLESKNVTKGARNKIILSIKKLHKRPDLLAEIEQDVEKPGELLSCIDRLKQVLVTPIKPYPLLSDEPSPPTSTNTANTSVEDKDSSKQVSSTPGDSSSSSQEDSPQHVPATQDGGSSGGSSCSTPPSSPRLHRSSSASSIDDLLAKDFPQEDLPSLITRTIGKVFSQLMMHTETNEENLTSYIKLLDNAMCHEAFKVSHKKLFFDWKQQCQQTLRVISPKKSPRNRGWPNAFTIAGNPPQPKIPYPDKRNGRRSNVRINTMGPKVPTSIIGSPRSYSTLPKANPRQLHQPLPPPYYPPPRSRSNTGPSMKQPPIPIPAVLRAHRYVNMTIPSPMEVSETHMDELCKSVTEHALEDQSDL